MRECKTAGVLFLTRAGKGFESRKMVIAVAFHLHHGPIAKMKRHDANLVQVRRIRRLTSRSQLWRTVLLDLRCALMVTSQSAIIGLDV